MSGVDQFLPIWDHIGFWLPVIIPGIVFVLLLPVGWIFSIWAGDWMVNK